MSTLTSKTASEVRYLYGDRVIEHMVEECQTAMHISPTTITLLIGIQDEQEHLDHILVIEAPESLRKDMSKISEHVCGLSLLFAMIMTDQLPHTEELDKIRVEFMGMIKDAIPDPGEAVQLSAALAAEKEALAEVIYHILETAGMDDYVVVQGVVAEGPGVITFNIAAMDKNKAAIDPKAMAIYRARKSRTQQPFIKRKPGEGSDTLH